MSEETQINHSDYAPDGYVSSNARNTTVAMLGHMVTTRWAERVDCAYSVDFESTVNYAQSIGLGRKFIPVPRFGADAFRVSLRTLKTNPHEITLPLDQGIAYDNMRCKVWYDCVQMGKEYAIRRHSTGLVNGVEHTTVDNMYRVSYRAASGDVIARTYHRAYVKRAWEGVAELSEAEQAALEGDSGVDNIDMEPYIDGNLIDHPTFQKFFNAVKGRYEEEITRVDTRRWRAKTRSILEKDYNAIPFTAVRGAVIIPDTRTSEESKDADGKRTPPPYLDELDAMNNIMQWFGGLANETTGTVQFEDETIPGLDPEEDVTEEKTTVATIVDNVQNLSRSPCQMTIMGYIDDEAQRVELQREMTHHVNDMMNDYLNEFTESLNSLNDDDQENVNRAIKKFAKRKNKMQKTLEFYCGGDFVDGVNINSSIGGDDRLSGLRTRITNLGSGTGINVNGLRELVEFEQ